MAAKAGSRAPLRRVEIVEHRATCLDIEIEAATRPMGRAVRCVAFRERRHREDHESGAREECRDQQHPPRPKTKASQTKANRIRRGRGRTAASRPVAQQTKAEGEDRAADHEEARSFGKGAVSNENNHGNGSDCGQSRKKPRSAPGILGARALFAAQQEVKRLAPQG